MYLGGSSNGVLFLLQNFNITMAVGPGPSYWNKAMKKLCMFVSLCMGVWYVQPRLIWFLDRFLGLRTCRMVSGHVEWFLDMYSRRGLGKLNCIGL